jgi:uncharacterized protein YbaR (Trm112 family)
MILSPDLLAKLVCPKSKQGLTYFPRGEDDRDEGKAFLLSAAARLRYRIEAGVPVLLIDEAEGLSEREVARLLERAKALGISKS